MQRAFLVVPALGFLAGAAAQLRGFGLPLLAVALVLAVAPATNLAFLRRARASCVAAAIGTALGTLATGVHGEPSFAARDARSHVYAGAVIERGVAEDTLTLRLDDGRRVAAFVPNAVPLAVGARVQMRAQFEPPDDARNPGEPSPHDIAAERGIAGRLAHVRIIGVEQADARDATLWLPRLRAWAGDRIRERIDEPFATILIGAMWGERGALPPDLRAEFQDTGTVHVLVTAGLHLGVVAALALWLFERAGACRSGAALAAIAVVWAYAVFSGAHLPSLRAATMASFCLIARAAGRPALSWNALALAAIVVAALRPASVLSLSFALSFSCVGSIVLFAEPFGAALERLHCPALAREALALTFATQVGTWPLTASAFLVIAPYAPLANALVVPVVGAAMLGGFATLLSTPVPPLAQACANVETSFLAWIVGVVCFVGTLPGAHVVATPPPNWTIAVYDCTLVGAAVLASCRRRIAAAALIAGAVALCLWPPRGVKHDLRVTAIDVGQADALLIQTPAGHAYLVDAGGRLERASLDGGSPAELIGERVVVPFLVRHGIHRLDAILISHPHGDHVGGAAPALHTLGAGAMADSGQTYAGHAYHDALDAARKRGVPLLEPRDGDVWTTSDGVTFRFYGPSEPYLTGTRNDINSNSLVFRLEYGTFRMLFTGDAGSEAEARMLASGVNVRADVLKVGHHGSAYSSTPEFIGAVSPRAAIISVGRDNLFGHPAGSTLKTLAALSATIYRTDRDGAVSVESDGARFSIVPFVRVAGLSPTAPR